MSERLIYDENQEISGITPVLELETLSALETVTLDYENTKLRIFENSQMDHIEYTDPEGGRWGIYFDEFTEPDVRERLMALHYPTNPNPVASDEDIHWYDKSFLEAYDIAPLNALTSEEPVAPEPVPEQDSRSSLIARTISLVAAPAIAAFGLLGKIR